MKNLIWLVVLVVIGCSADLVIEKGQYVDYCNLDDTGRLIITVKNIGSDKSVPCNTCIEFGKYGFENVPTPAIEAGNLMLLSPVYIPRGCYDSDCGFKITVDSENTVSEGESGEANNSVIGNCIG